MKFKQYDMVRIIEIINPEKEVKSEYDLVAQKVGDIVVIVKVYTNPSLGYELE